MTAADLRTAAIADTVEYAMSRLRTPHGIVWIDRAAVVVDGIPADWPTRLALATVLRETGLFVIDNPMHDGTYQIRVYADRRALLGNTVGTAGVSFIRAIRAMPWH